MPPKNKEAILRLRISEKLKEEAKSLADDMGESLSNVVRDALREHIRNQRTNPPPGTIAKEEIKTEGGIAGIDDH